MVISKSIQLDLSDPVRSITSWSWKNQKRDVAERYFFLKSAKFSDDFILFYFTTLRCECPLISLPLTRFNASLIQLIPAVFLRWLLHLNAGLPPLLSPIRGIYSVIPFIRSSFSTAAPSCTFTHLLKYRYSFTPSISSPFIRIVDFTSRFLHQFCFRCLFVSPRLRFCRKFMYHFLYLAEAMSSDAIVPESVVFLTLYLYYDQV